MALLVEAILLMAVAAMATEAEAQALPGCQDSCGNVSIPYPFGTRPTCYRDADFNITCDNTTNKAYFGNIEVINVSPIAGELRIWTLSAYKCYNNSGVESWSNPLLTLAKFTLSHTKNKFTAVGCDTEAFIEGSLGRNYSTGCIAMCSTNDRNSLDESCSGIGCCQTSIPRGVRGTDISVFSFNNHSDVLDFNPCSYAFVAEENSFNFSEQLLESWQNGTKYPVVLDWTIGDQTCAEAQSESDYACKENSYCYDVPDIGAGYRCNCSQGYEGNPYLSNGCINIDECSVPNDCHSNARCTDLNGTYRCTCFEGYRGDGWTNGTGCVNNHSQTSLWILITLGISVGFLVLFMVTSGLSCLIKQRKLIKLKEKCFEQNGGMMLQQQLLKHGRSVEAPKIFTADDLKKATDNYHESRILGQGGYGTVYKGTLPDKRLVAIKKSKLVDQSQVQQFINEVIVLTQINHRHVVKLLGCCLETEVPMLVYEFIANGALDDHIHNTNASSMTWETRLRIAAEAADAISYLHSAASPPILHRDIKPANILLDENYSTKVSDFGAARLVPIDQTQLSTLVQGTIGYLDPEYFQSSQLTDKSDVYSFGVVLIELLTGRKVLCFDRPEKERNLVSYFVSSMKEDCLCDILDMQVRKEADVEQLKEVALLTERCLRLKGEERPSMKEVAMELEGLRRMETHPWILHNKSEPEEREYLLKGSENVYDGAGSSNNPSSTYDSIRNEVILAFDGAR